MRTPILNRTDETFESVWSKLSKDVQERWGEDFLKVKYDVNTQNVFIKYAEDPMKVVRTLQHAIMNTDPYIRYRPGWQSSFLFFPLSMMPACLVDWITNKSVSKTILPAGVYKQLKN